MSDTWRNGKTISNEEWKYWTIGVSIHNNNAIKNKNKYEFTWPT
jgi:hypothetical protein